MDNQNKTGSQTIKKRVEEQLLLNVQKPGRYIGGEVNSILKPITKELVRFAFAFPDIYEVGMSHVGLKVLYHALNAQENIFCERVFAPWTDADKVMKEQKIPLFSLETFTPLADFDIVGFTLQYEMCYTNVLNMLFLGNIPFYAAERGEEMPLIIAGGPCTVNAEPIAAFFDAFFIGEGEEAVVELCRLVQQMKGQGRAEVLRAIAQIEGFYVPSLYDVCYHDDGTICAVTPKEAQVPARVKKRIIADLDKAPYPDKPIVPYIQIVHDRACQELFRGCIRGCRFCQAGFIYRPVRGKNYGTVIDQIDKMIASTGYDEVSLVSLSTMDYPPCADVVGDVIDRYGEKVSVALPSLRMDDFSIDIAKNIQKVRKTGLTFAPEAGSERMRRVINKGIEREDILRTAKEVFKAGWGRLKLYFMMGLPYEEDEDLRQIATLAEEVLAQYYALDKQERSREVTVAVSVACFVPKPHTPFQWAAQNSMAEFTRKQQLLFNEKRARKITLKTHTSELSVLEGVFALGDRRLAKVIELAWKNGCVFDGWDECFDYDKWMTAFEEAGVDPAFYAHREKPYDETLPWDHIDVGVKKDFLVAENEKARQACNTPNCAQQCGDCGIRQSFEGYCKW